MSTQAHRQFPSCPAGTLPPRRPVNRPPVSQECRERSHTTMRRWMCTRALLPLCASRGRSRVASRTRAVGRPHGGSQEHPAPHRRDGLTRRWRSRARAHLGPPPPAPRRPRAARPPGAAGASPLPRRPRHQSRPARPRLRPAPRGPPHTPASAPAQAGGVLTRTCRGPQLLEVDADGVEGRRPPRMQAALPAGRGARGRLLLLLGPARTQAGWG